MAKEEKGQPRLSSAGSEPPSPPSPPGLSSPQSEPTELLNDSEEILRDEDMAVARKRTATATAGASRMMMRRRRMTTGMLEPVPYHVHLCAGESSDSGEGVRGTVKGWVDGWVLEGWGVRLGRIIISAYACELDSVQVCLRLCLHVRRVCLRVNLIQRRGGGGSRTRALMARKHFM